MENFFLDVIFVVEDHDPSKALEYSGKGLLKLGNKCPRCRQESHLKLIN